MRALTQNSRRGFSLLLLFAGAAACGGDSEPDAYGNFEPNEVSVSAQTSGQLITFTPVEGAQLQAGATVGLVDTTQLSLERAQMIAQREATSARVSEAGNQIGVYQAQLAIAQRNYERMRRLFEQSAATAQQRDQAERDYRTLVAQIAAARAQQQSVSREVASTAARVAEITDKIRKSRIINPRQGPCCHLRQGGRGSAVGAVAVQDRRRRHSHSPRVHHRASSPRSARAAGAGARRSGRRRLLTLPGIVRWVSSKAEFTPTPVQTRDERADLCTQ